MKTLGFLMLVAALIIGLAYIGIQFKDVDLSQGNTGNPSPTVTLSPEETDQNTTPTQPPEGFTSYTSEDDTISFIYPQDWETVVDGQRFRDGDLFTAQTVGPDQTEGTEFFDGAYFSVAIPQTYEDTLDQWIADYHNFPENNAEEITQTTINGREYTRVYVCGLGCFDYYHTRVGDTVYSFLVFAAAPNQEREQEFRQKLQSTLASVTISENN